MRNELKAIVLTSALIAILAVSAVGIVLLLFQLRVGEFRWFPILLLAFPILGLLFLATLILALDFVDRYRHRPVSRSPEEVALILLMAAENRLGVGRWSRFRRHPITDLSLDRIRKRAVLSGPPNADRLMMKQLAKEAVQDEH